MNVTDVFDVLSGFLVVTDQKTWVQVVDKVLWVADFETIRMIL